MRRVESRAMHRAHGSEPCAWKPTRDTDFGAGACCRDPENPTRIQNKKHTIIVARRSLIVTQCSQDFHSRWRCGDYTDRIFAKHVQQIYKTLTRILQGFYKDFTNILQEIYKYFTNRLSVGNED